MRKERVVKNASNRAAHVSKHTILTAEHAENYCKASANPTMESNPQISMLLPDDRGSDRVARIEDIEWASVLALPGEHTDATWMKLNCWQTGRGTRLHAA